MLLEAFKNCVSEKIVVYLNEQKVTTLQQAATLADEFALTHKNMSVRQYSFSHDDTVKKPSNAQSIRISSGAQGDKRCFYCNKSDHLIADCVLYKRKPQSPVAKPPKGVGLIKTVSTCGSQLVLKEPDECFKPFISKVLRDTGGSSSFILASVL